MPTNRTKRSRSGQQLDYWKISQLLDGMPWLGMGYAPVRDGCNHWSDETWQAYHDAMRADWERLGVAFMAWWRGETEQFSAVYASIGGKRPDPSVTPWALTEFGEPE